MLYNIPNIIVVLDELRKERMHQESIFSIISNILYLHRGYGYRIYGLIGTKKFLCQVALFSILQLVGRALQCAKPPVKQVQWQ